MKKALIASLFFNVLLLGIGCGYFLNQIKGPLNHWQLKGELRNSLSEESQKYFDEWLNKVSSKGNFRHKHREIMKLLEAEHFDDSAFIKLSYQLKQEHVNRVDIFSDATISLASKLKIEERKLLARHLPRLARPKRMRHKH